MQMGRSRHWAHVAQNCLLADGGCLRCLCRLRRRLQVGQCGRACMLMLLALAKPAALALHALLLLLLLGQVLLQQVLLGCIGHGMAVRQLAR